MLNSGTSSLKQILNMGQSVCNRNGLGYIGVTNDVATTSKIVFVKATATTQNHFGSGKIIKPALPMVKRFVPICHYCKKPGHIRPKCFKYKNTFRMNSVEQPYYKSRTAPKHKIDLKNKFVKKIWVKKSYLNCYVASTSLKTVSIDSFHFAKGCSRHVTGEREFLKRVSRENEVVCLTENTENQLQKTVVAPSVATEKDPDNETEPFVTTTSAKEIEMDRKTRDKPRLKQASRAWYENLTKNFD